MTPFLLTFRGSPVTSCLQPPFTTLPRSSNHKTINKYIGIIQLFEIICTNLAIVNRGPQGAPHCSDPPSGQPPAGLRQTQKEKPWNVRKIHSLSTFYGKTKGKTLYSSTCVSTFIHILIHTIQRKTHVGINLGIANH